MRWSWALAGILLSVGRIRGDGFEAPAILKVSEVPIGATGFWRTCVEGTAVTEFPMRVVGLMPNSIYPGEPVILCEALDGRNKHSGPVAGMSGSPVYVDGKIIGAYAYGAISQRDQALFMATPIEAMLRMQALPRGGGAGSVKSELAHGWKDMLAPLSVAGASAKAAAWLAEQLAPYGITVAQGGAGGVTNFVAELEPGSPVAGVILHGDVSAAAVGTVTYRNGDTILAFGHPFLQCGAIEMPMAGAEILAVSHSFVRSYKLSNVGQIIGTIEQDRAPAVVGRIGRMPRTVEVVIRTRHPVLGVREYRSVGLRHERFTPMVIMFALMDPLEMALDASRIRTTRYEVELEFDGGEVIALTNVVADGEEWVAVESMMGLTRRLLMNEFAPLALRRFAINLAYEEEVQRARLMRAWLDRSEFRAGEEVRVHIEVQPYQTNREMRTVSVQLPADLVPGEYSIQVCDAAKVEEFERLREMKPTSIAGLCEVARRQRRSDCVYVRLVGGSSGLVMGSEALAALPPSVAARWRGEASGSISEAVIAEAVVPMGAVVQGFQQLTCKVKQ